MKLINVFNLEVRLPSEYILMIEEKIKNILEKEVKPMLAMHLGSLDFVSFSDGVLSVRLLGTCKGCPLSNLTLKAGIEELLRSKLSEVKSVRALE